MPTKTELTELAMRSLWTFVKVFLGGLTLAGTGVVDVQATQVAFIAAAGAVLGLLQVFAAQQLDSAGAASKLLGGSASV